MRGYGRSSNYDTHADYALEHSVDDMLELLADLGRERAVWVGHDWGSPVVWSLASHHPECCEAIANLCVPYIADGFAPGNLIALVNRAIYPEATYPAGQWEYQLFYEAHFDRTRSTFEADIENTIRALFRKDSPAERVSSKTREPSGEIRRSEPNTTHQGFVTFATSSPRVSHH
jgi:pimeloyl-ACP methyl ester carboxylesterase